MMPVKAGAARSYRPHVAEATKNREASRNHGRDKRVVQQMKAAA